MKYIYSTLLLLLISCKIFKTEYIDAPIGMTINDGYSNFTYEDFPNEDVNKGDTNYKERFTDSNHRIGEIRGGYKEGKWLAGNVDFNDKMNVESEGVTKEEYFKSGLRDSIFRQFDNDGKIIYETAFKMGTGLWKEFHSNGTLYFEIYTQDGYFTDTLRLYNKKGRLTEKLLYEKDKLVFNQNYDPNIVDTIENGRKVKNTYKQRWIDSYKTKDWLYKKKLEDESFTYNEKGEIIEKTQKVVVNGIEKNYKETINGDQIIRTIRTVKLKDTLFESEKEYKNGCLIKHKFIPKQTKKNHYLFCIEGFDEQGNKTYISFVMRINPNIDKIYSLTKTDYFKNEKKIFRSNEILLNVSFTKNQSIQIETIEKTYYDLNNKLFKKEDITRESGTEYVSCSQGSSSRKVDETKILKTEYYKDDVIIKTEENKKTFSTE